MRKSRVQFENIFVLPDFILEDVKVNWVELSQE